MRTGLLLSLVGLVCFQLLAVTPGIAQSTSAAVGRTPAAAKEPAAPALPPAAAANSRAPAMRKVQPGWVQREGYVPVPETIASDEPRRDPNALPPANAWGNFATIDLDKPFANDPTGTNVFADTKYAPAAVRAAVEAQQNPDFDAPMPPTAGGMGGGMGGGMASNLQQSYSPSAPVMAEPPAPAPASDNVFSGGNNAFNNRYTPSVGNAIGSSDLLVQMILDAPEQEAAKRTDVIRQMMGQISNTQPNRIFVYQTRTINNPKGQPSTAITFLMKNNVDAERSRQQAIFSSTDQMRGFIDAVAKGARVQITPGTIKVSSAVNDGSMGGGAAAGAMPGQMPGQMGPMMGPNGMMMPGAAGTPAAAALAVPAAPAKNSAGSAAAGVLSSAAMLLALLAVF